MRALGEYTRVFSLYFSSSPLNQTAVCEIQNSTLDQGGIDLGIFVFLIFEFYMYIRIYYLYPTSSGYFYSLVNQIVSVDASTVCRLLH